ncbi:hypothetical protein ACRDU6_11155 [Mycolicibacterium sp. ELW1]|uniref:hypothetical protein n=1 Tax=Mycobacteriaceae TaxID=1762 RepID=UPI0011EF14B7|nr:hypothetical protein [Mycobacterium sp. ELW1]QEN13163.1 hypothetical protein D3H54_07725 [Mycobacterium sp. ELW1]
MTTRLQGAIAPLILAGVTAVTAALAPVAGAASNTAACRDNGGASLCQRQGHASIKVDKPSRAPQPFGFNIGFGPMNPLWALG